MYIAHKTDDGKVQSIKDHLQGVAKLAESYAIEEFKSFAYAAGIGHDIGKYTDSFQGRINGDINCRVEHSLHGALEYRKLIGSKNPFLPILEYCILGHHSGLPDGGSKNDSEDSATLHGRLARERKAEDCSKYKNEIELLPLNIKCLCNYLNEAVKNLPDKHSQNLQAIELYAFFTRYVFSCLVDADFIDTERFCNPESIRGMKGDFEKALERLNIYMSKFTDDTAVKKARKELLNQAEKESKNNADIYLLNMPTGSGKTLCSLKIALEKAVAENKKRIVYVIPYTSIIEQTALVFKEVLGDSVEILQHHSNYSFENDYGESENTDEKYKKSCENWDAKIIVTTSVQFFQSLYHYKGSRLRKLHNLADSIMIFDEIHLIPVEHIQPCIRAIGYITEYLNSKAIFLSATMPNYTDIFDKFTVDNSVCELIKNKDCFSVFDKCSFYNLGKISFENIIEKSTESESSLIIVNKKSTAKRLYSIISGKKFHLSTYMTPVHRSEVIKEIKESLKKHEKIVVVSTSLIEAGVDLDFQTVFRELAGLDSILQSAGRCNREGLREGSVTYIFETEEKVKGDVKYRANITRSILNEYKNISSDECISDYFSRVFSFNNELIMKNNLFHFGDTTYNSLGTQSIPFRSYAENFEYIKSDTVSIVYNCNEKVNELLEKIKFENINIKRKLQKYSISVNRSEFDNMKKMGIIDDSGSGVWVLNNGSYYDEHTGLDIDKTFDAII